MPRLTEGEQREALAVIQREAQAEERCPSCLQRFDGLSVIVYNPGWSPCEECGKGVR